MNSARRPTNWLVVTLAGIALLATACARTDQSHYASGAAGQSTFRNMLRDTAVWLGGCTAFVQERLSGGSWMDEGGEFVCVWEGLASPVAAKDIRTDDFTARAPGTWRLSYALGIGCQPDQPLGEVSCDAITRIRSNRFTVAAADDHEAFCTATGGTWELAACGNLHCGLPNACLALIPGCDCGPDANFVNAVGCVEDPVCADPGSAHALCEETGGAWDPFSCGHYSCGAPPDCAAVIPGCNCGPFSVFDEEFGCLAVPCGAPR